MLSNPDLIIYLWLIPIFLLLILPLFLTVGNLSIRLTRLFVQPKESISPQEKRQHQRTTPYEETVAEIQIGDTTCTGLVCNISKFGIKLKNIPELLSHEIEKLTITVQQYGIIGHNLTIQPKWMLLTDSGYQLGAEIAEAPAGWEDYLLQTERISQT